MVILLFAFNIYTIQHFRHGTYLNGLVYYSDITRVLSISENDI